MRKLVFCVLLILSVSSCALGQSPRSKDSKTIGFVSIAFNLDRPNQTAPFRPRTLLTPAKDTLYQVSFYGVVTAAAENAQYVSASLNWTDDGGPEQVQFQIPVTSSHCGTGTFNSNACSWITTVRVNAGTPLQLGTSFYPSDAQITYDLFATVLVLQQSP